MKSKNTPGTSVFRGNYKMLVLDLDDTLLNDKCCISDKTKKILIKAQMAGIKIVLASGRPTPAMLRYARELQLDRFESFIISYNGAVITDMKTNQVLFERTLTMEEIHSLHDFSVLHNIHIITYSDQGVISETDSEYIDIEIGLSGMPHCKVPAFKEAITFSATKCIMLEEPGYLKTIEEKLKAERSDLSVSLSKPFFLEVMPKGIDKAASVALLADRLSIKQEEIIAVGNASNDLGMIEYAGLGVWVDNVSPELRHYADVVVASNNDDGVAEVVERFILVD